MPAPRTEPLRHNPSNPITAAIERVHHADGTTTIRKRLTGSRPPHHPDWVSSDDPRHWNHWRREAQAYLHDLASDWREPGLRMPRLLTHTEVDGDHVLELEDVPGTTGAALSRDQLTTAARRLGRGQGRTLAPHHPDRPWLSRRMLRDYTASKHVDPRLYDSDVAWSHPLIARCWAPTLRPALTRLHGQREALLDLLDRLPATLSHLDLWSHNLVHTPSGDIVVLDWASAGWGAVGHDAHNLVAEAVLDALVDVAHLDDLAHDVLDAYTHGLDDVGAGAVVPHARVGFHAASVKWHWMGALHLARVHTGGHHAYGGAPTDPEPQLVARGRALHRFADWAEQALADAGGLPGVP